MNCIQILRRLVKIPSPSGEEQKIARYIFQILRKHFTVMKQKVGNRYNILACIGKPRILLTTHMDTVTGNIPYKEDKEYIYGRGSCDAKASIASMICAAIKAKQQGLKNIGLLFDVSEETCFAGIKQAKKLVRPKLVILGEPTNNKIIAGQKGLLGIKIKCKGKTAHGAQPEKGINAIYKLTDLLSRLKTMKFPESTIGKTTINVGQITGGNAINVVPDYAEATTELRTTTNNTIKQIYKQIPKKNIEVLYNYEPVFPKIKNNNIAPYFTEMYFWRKTKAIILGAGDIKYAHSQNEKIRKNDVKKAEKLYLRIIRRQNL
ncbi:M20/M25/M40 family metallo-hydrolase [Candidatus Woesearchaeota archaeon]|nr:M20/M25/M40 family metallo-hydrolase [Candidatus Woesearchaeota archaeon]